MKARFFFVALALFGASMALGDAVQHCDVNQPLATLLPADGGAVAIPTTCLAGRTGIIVCNSAEQDGGSALIKCNMGSKPTFGPTNKGQLIAVGACYAYPVSCATTVFCMANNPATYASSIECQ